jgi:hypothetical protein
MQQQLSMPPAVIMQRFCSMPAETASSQVHVTFMPPGHFVKLIVHRGTIIMFMPGAVVVWVPIIPEVPDIGIPGIGIPGMAAPERSIIFAVAILISSFVGSSCGDSPPSGETAAF